MYFLNEIALNARNEIRRLERLCEQNGINIERHFNYEAFNSLWYEADLETREWFSIDAPLHQWKDGYAQGDATQEELAKIASETDLIEFDGESWDFTELDKEFAKRYEQAYKQQIENTETAILNEIELENEAI